MTENERKMLIASKVQEFLSELDGKYTQQYIADALGVPSGSITMIRNLDKPGYMNGIGKSNWEVFDMISKRLIRVEDKCKLKVYNRNPHTNTAKVETFDLDDESLEFPLVGDGKKLEKKSHPTDRREAWKITSVQERLKESVDKTPIPDYTFAEGDIEDMEEPKRDDDPNPTINRTDRNVILTLEIIEDLVRRLDRIEDLIKRQDLETILTSGRISSELVIKYHKK